MGGCERLRHFLKLKQYKLKSGVITFGPRYKKMKNQRNIPEQNKEKKFELNSEMIELLEQQIKFNEIKVENETKYRNLAFDQKFFLSYYLLLNMDLILVRNYLKMQTIQ